MYRPAGLRAGSQSEVLRRPPLFMPIVSVTYFIGLFHPVFQHPLKLSLVIRHQYRAGRNSLPVYRRVVRACRRPGLSQGHLNLRMMMLSAR